MRSQLLGAALLAGLGAPAAADEGGLSFWLPGQFGSLAAVPVEPGLSASMLYYHTSVAAGAGRAFPNGGETRVGIDGNGNLFALGAAYAFKEPVLGGQAAFSLLGIFGRNEASVDAILTGPRGREISGRRSEALTSYGDLFPLASLKWNDGVHNRMVYVTGNIPVGDYDSDRLANLGLGHAAVDGGVGYTYFDPATGWEASVVTGLTYNFENQQTDYQNGISGHVDIAVSKFLTESLQIGAAGYLYQQLTDDSGAPPALGGFRSRVAGVGPQIGYFFDAGEMQGYANLRGYQEFAADNRPEGWNVFFTLAFSPKRQAE